MHLQPFSRVILQMKIARLFTVQKLEFHIKYEDPKKSDGTPEMNETYFNRSLEIATEMKFVFENLRKS